ncbi:MAG: STAS domain-containing protein [Candidatus Sumerlaeaceae bacterium]|nr:STAS domain-containing protein [Candidatus Sumerlaeaceae bacterium]
MSASEQQKSTADYDSLRFAELGEGIIVLQIHGAGSFTNSIAFKKLADRFADHYGAGKYFFIVDLEKCKTMDSTFLGALASVALRQKKECGRMLIITNANEHTRRLLTTLGVSHFVEMREAKPETAETMAPDSAFQEEKVEEVSKIERIVHMIETHQKLCEIDSENEARFQSVLKYLNESLEKEKRGGEN